MQVRHHILLFSVVLFNWYQSNSHCVVNLSLQTKALRQKVNLQQKKEVLMFDFCSPEFATEEEPFPDFFCSYGNQRPTIYFFLFEIRERTHMGNLIKKQISEQSISFSCSGFHELDHSIIAEPFTLSQLSRNVDQQFDR